jgi:hypothetical protein
MTAAAAWTPEEVDYMLDAILPMDTPVAFNGAAARVATALGRGERADAHGVRDHGPIRRRLEGALLMWVHQEYVLSGKPRTKRSTDEPTYVECWCIDKMVEAMSASDAQLPKEAAGKRPTFDYVAAVLNRPVWWVEWQYKVRGPQQGRADFGNLMDMV